MPSQWQQNLRAWNESRNQSGSGSKRGWFVPSKGTKAHKEVSSFHVPKTSVIQPKPAIAKKPKCCPTCGKG